MSLIIKSNTSGNIPPIEAGTYPAVCYGLVDMGDQYSKTYDKWTRKLLIMWEIPGETIDLGMEQPVSRTITRTYTMSLNDKAELRKVLESWRGRPFTDDELHVFDMRTILGAPCLLSIIHRESTTGGTYAAISGVMKLPKGMQIDPPTLDKITFDLDEDSLDKLKDLPEWVESRIKESRTYEQRIHPDSTDDDVQEQDDDEEVPF